MSTDKPLYDEKATQAAEAAMDCALDDFLAPKHQEAVAVKAPAGAGKSHFVSRAVGRTQDAGMRVAVGAPTNEQVFGLVRTLALLHPRRTVAFLGANGVQLPAAAQLPNVVRVDALQANAAGLVVATLDKLGDKHTRRALGTFDALCIDEAYQANSPQYYSVAHYAHRHLLVGDSGQLDPFSTIKHADQWRGLPEDPLQTAIGSLLRNHPHTPVHHMPITRRLDARAVPIVEAFYPDFVFRAAVLEGVRELNVVSTLTRDKQTRLHDKVLDLAAHAGWAHLELPEAPVLQTDPEIVDTIVAMVRRLFVRNPQVRCERNPEWSGLAPHRVAIGVSHNDQKNILRMRLDDAGLPGVVVNTANKLQGLEYDFVIAWHPLAGLPEADPFHLDPGRLCVLMTRHRHGCVVIGRAGDRALVEGVPPATPAYLGWSPDPVLDGWGIHQTIFRALEPWRIAG